MRNHLLSNFDIDWNTSQLIEPIMKLREPSSLFFALDDESKAITLSEEPDGSAGCINITHPQLAGRVDSGDIGFEVVLEKNMPVSMDMAVFSGGSAAMIEGPYAILRTSNRSTEFALLTLFLHLKKVMDSIHEEEKS